MARSWVRLFAGATLTLSLTGHALADEGKITVFAAASLTNAMQDIAAVYKKEKNVEVVSSFASSSTLARQIEAGAPADLFISADQKWMDYAVEKNLLIRLAAKPCWEIARWWSRPQTASRRHRHQQTDGLDPSAQRWPSGGGRSGACSCRDLCERSAAKTGRMGDLIAEAGSRRRCARRAGAGGA